MHDYQYGDFDFIELSDDFYVKDSCPVEFNNTRLKKPTDEELFSALYQWFHARYCDPAENTPYDGREGGYQWIHGGPYDVFEELEKRFQDVVPFEIIEKVADFICESTGIHEWAPLDWERPDEDFYEIPIDESSDIFVNLKDNVSKLLKVEMLSGEEIALQISRNLLFTSLITALEVYLYETVIFWITNDRILFMKLVTRFEKTKHNKVTYEEIFNVFDGLEDEIKEMMQHNIVWHNKKDVRNIFKSVFDFDVNLSIFKDEILKRHHIIHRVSKDFKGCEVKITKEDVIELSNKIISFAEEIEKKLIPYYIPL